MIGRKTRIMTNCRKFCKKNYHIWISKRAPDMCHEFPTWGWCEVRQHHSCCNNSRNHTMGAIPNELAPVFCLQSNFTKHDLINWRSLIRHESPRYPEWASVWNVSIDIHNIRIDSFLHIFMRPLQLDMTKCSSPPTTRLVEEGAPVQEEHQNSAHDPSPPIRCRFRRFRTEEPPPPKWDLSISLCFLSLTPFLVSF